jgi:hypothetical protein
MTSSPAAEWGTTTARVVASRSAAASTAEEKDKEDHHRKSSPAWTVQDVERYVWDAPIVAALLG